MRQVMHQVLVVSMAGVRAVLPDAGIVTRVADAPDVSGRVVAGIMVGRSLPAVAAVVVVVVVGANI